MHRFGVFATVAGILLIAAGMLIGFGLLMLDKDDLAIFFLGTIPLGFVLLLTGVTTTQLSRPDN
ncbi:MAG: hypothetical protein P8Z78_06060 [Gammaproteobacteria bacterium]